jgi:hypothetical protein
VIRLIDKRTTREALAVLLLETSNGLGRRPVTFIPHPDIAGLTW